MAVVLSLHCSNNKNSQLFNPLSNPSPLINASPKPKQLLIQHPKLLFTSSTSFSGAGFYRVVNKTQENLNCSSSNSDPDQKGELQSKDIGVQAALSVLNFYKREISPLLPKSCRYVPTCSEYSMIAYKKYGVVKGTVLTACRICRCNPLGGSGFDPPRWFGEETPPED